MHRFNQGSLAAVGTLAAEAENRTCVLADDDGLLLAYLAAVFRTRGYDVVTATSGQAALRLVRERLPAFVLLDVGMPDLDGYQVLWAIRQASATREIPVIMLTGRKGDANVLKAFDRGADDYVTKPVLPAELLGRIDRILEARL
jgi:DNA-binding response OmpR family regulator